MSCADRQQLSNLKLVAEELRHAMQESPDVALERLHALLHGALTLVRVPWPHLRDSAPLALGHDLVGERRARTVF